MSNSTEKPANGDNKIRGVFSSQKVMKVGTGTTTRKTVQQTFHYAEELPNGDIELQLLNANHMPAGSKETVTKDELLQKYSPEPELYQTTVYPKMKEVGKTLARADRHRKRGETFSAEMCYNDALKVDDQNVRANFGIGMCYLQRGESAKADDILKRIVKLDAAFEEEHKHMFNEFGINLRKNKMAEQAVEYYKRAAEFTKNDENLQYNIARAYFDQGRFADAKTYCEKALTINPDLDEAKKMIELMLSKKLLDN
ncbi:MAG: tetratricopeptide repeat protein [Desulfovibrio sp.]|uniref:tetratricopeptide repeat protein n=1 Tax=Desulfovibrio sp. 7SRBS1 TaxID=3378064 RepID=UPI003B3D47F6